MLKTEKKYLFLYALIILSFFYGIAQNPLFDLDEGAFSEATREMVRGGDYITTYLNGRLRFDKPILIYWCQSFFVHIFGIKSFAFRLPSVISALIWMYLIYVFMKKMKDEETAFAAVFMTVSSVVVSVVAKLAIADALLNMTMTASMFAIYMYFTSGNKKYIYLAHAAIGVGILTKGPVAILIPFAVSFIFFLTEKRMKDWATAVFNPAGLALMFAVALPWYVLEYMEQGMDFINGFFLKHNVQRFSGTMEGHAGGFIYYVPVLLVGVLPYTSLIFSFIKRCRMLWADRFLKYMLVWFVFVFVFFSLSGTKLPHYMLYGMTPVFIMCSVMFRHFKSKLLLGIPAIIFLLLLTMLPVFLHFAVKSAGDLFTLALLKEFSARLGLWVQIPVAAMTVLAVLFIFTKDISYRTYAAMLSFFVIISLNVVYLPILADVKQGPVREAAVFARENGMKMNLWASRMPSFNVYYDGLTEKTKPVPGETVFIKDHKILKIEYPYEVIREWPGYRLIKLTEQ
jgi:4-amino-4-deoxy-L-arabinose transferase-like glycosyltransferase